MDISKRRVAGFGAALALLLSLPVAFASDNAFPDTEELTSRREEKPPARRTTGFFTRVRRESPREQMAYANHLKSQGRLYKAGRAYLALVCAWPDSDMAPKAQAAYADTLERRGKSSDAFEEYQYLIDRYAGSFVFEEVIARQYEIASRRKDVAMLDQVVRNAPSWSRAAEAQFQLARLREEKREYALALAEYQIVQSRYPRSPQAEEAAFRECVCLYETCRRERPRDEVAHLTARASFLRFLQVYPATPRKAQAEACLKDIEEQFAAMGFAQAEFYDTRCHPRRSKAALLAYRDFVRRFPFSDRGEAARLRIAELEEEIGKEK